MSGTSRRAFLLGASAAALAVPLVGALPRGASAAPGLTGLDVRPRSAWAQGLPTPSPLPQEQDVRFLIVHHSASPNGYAPDAVPGVLRGFHGFHTGADKGWPDVAYNFFVDRFGVVWEGRAGSLEGPVLPDATGGSQGFSQIACFIGDHSTEPPTPEAQRSMILVLAALAERHGIDPSPGATTNFVSRGSNRWPAGAAVTASTIAGHRDMSETTCPGEAAYPLVRDVFPAEVAAVLAARAPQPPPEPAPAEEPSPAPVQPAPETPAAEEGSTEDGGLDGTTTAVVLGGAGVVAATAATVTVLQLRGRRGAGPEQ
ncbi:peptidoglycan recognition protein family protein [Candidatus Blastococcus massiliensis]|uniref:peptidoglycan recognition protein family protein n=1 Tax=Candidatus Blastococcus massiliensis TaxID=1470358 RepID=UPI0004B3A6B2|nr:peptidoglycan recognition family protein [Candidatus Blastococcus massiliensis]